MVIEVYVVVH